MTLNFKKGYNIEMIRVVKINEQNAKGWFQKASKAANSPQAI